MSSKEVIKIQILIVSKSFITKEYLENFLKEKFMSKDINTFSDIKEIKVSIKSNALIIVQIDENNVDIVEDILNVKEQYKNLKITVLDMTMNKQAFIKCVKGNIDGYITNLENKEEFDFILKSIISGKKFYDSHITQNTIIDNLNLKIERLTKREIEIMSEVAKGLNNKEISKKLFITEYTVKKHITSIFNKLKIRSRQDIVIYVKDKERKIK